MHEPPLPSGWAPRQQVKRLVVLLKPTEPSRRNNSAKELQNLSSHCRLMTSATLLQTQTQTQTMFISLFLHTDTDTDNVYQSVPAAYRRWDSSVSSVTRLRAGQLRNYGSTPPGWGKVFSLLLTVQTG